MTLSTTLAISAHAAAVAADAVAKVAHAQTPEWTWNKRIAAAYRRATDAEAEAQRRMRDAVGGIVG